MNNNGFSHIFAKTHLNSSFPVSDRQFNQCTSQAWYLPTTETGDVLPANHCDRQWQSTHEQHQHFDHSSLWVQQRWHRPVLQCWSVRLTYWPQHGSSHCHLGLHHTTVRWEWCFLEGLVFSIAKVQFTKAWLFSVFLSNSNSRTFCDPKET